MKSSDIQQPGHFSSNLHPGFLKNLETNQLNWPACSNLYLLCDWSLFTLIAEIT